VNRRDLLKGAGIGAASVAVPTIASAKEPDKIVAGLTEEQHKMLCDIHKALTVGLIDVNVATIDGVSTAGAFTAVD